EMLRALGRRDEALKKFALLTHDKEWATRTHLRAAELYIETGDAASAHRLLEETRPTSIAERRERRVLRGRLELIQRRPERAVGVFQGLVKRPEGAAHSTLIAAVFGVAEAQVQVKTPEIADDVIEQFIDRHPADPDLPVLFARLDKLYRAEHKPSRNELERWVRSPRTATTNICAMVSRAVRNSCRAQGASATIIYRSSPHRRKVPGDFPCFARVCTIRSLR